MMRRTLLTLLVVLLASACSGTVIMSPLDPATIESNYKSGTDLNGIIIYRAIPVVEVDEFIQINVPQDPSKPGSPTIVSGDCTPTQIRKVISIADAQHPYRLHYRHGILEQYTFGANLNSDGVLTAVNTVSTPDQGKTFQNLTSAASSAAAIAKGITAGKPACTVTPAFVRYESVPSVP